MSVNSVQLCKPNENKRQEHETSKTRITCNCDNAYLAAKYNTIQYYKSSRKLTVILISFTVMALTTKKGCMW